MSFCSLTKGITPNICWFCLVLINSVLFNLLRVWIQPKLHCMVYSTITWTHRGRMSSYTANSKHWFATSFLQPLPYLVTSSGPENCQLTSSFFVGAQTVVSLLQTTHIISDVCFITDYVAYASSNKTKIVRIETELSFFLPRVDAPHVYVRAWALGCFHSFYQYPNLSEGADRVGGQQCGDKACPFSGVTKSGRVWRKVPESDARSVPCTMLRHAKPHT